MYKHPSQMEPLLPKDSEGALAETALMLVREASALGGALHPLTRPAVVDLLRQMNSYYSNLIEGHHTLPIDIERALRNDYSSDAAKRALQLESRAHIEVQALLEERLRSDSRLRICSADFLCWIHYEFYTRMPSEFRVVTDQEGNKETFEPGQLRHRDVIVGNHIPPSHTSLLEFLHRFEEFYDPETRRGLNQIVAAAAAHHRLAWIHPFVDGNGRVTRLHTNAYMIRIGLDSYGLWTVTRGLSRYKDKYLSTLMAADQPRQGDYDGRGHLSESGLTEFCQFFLETARDQVSFMSQLLNLPGLERRITKYIERRASLGEIPDETKYILRETLLRGEVPRGEVSRLTGRPERTARRILDQAETEGLVTSSSPKTPIQLAFPAKVVPYYFPSLYPEAVERTILEMSE